MSMKDYILNGFWREFVGHWRTDGDFYISCFLTESQNIFVKGPLQLVIEEF